MATIMIIQPLKVFFIFVAFSVGFLLNAEYVGWKSHIVLNSYNNIFNPVDFEDPGVLQWLYGNGRLKVFGMIGKYKDVEVIEEAMLAEEWYWVKFSHTNDKGNTEIDIQHIRVRWKPWEYYYEDEAMIPMTQEDIADYINNGTLNSNESDRAFRLRDEKSRLERKKESK